MCGIQSLTQELSAAGASSEQVTISAQMCWMCCKFRDHLCSDVLDVLCVGCAVSLETISAQMCWMCCKFRDHLCSDVLDVLSKLRAIIRRQNCLPCLVTTFQQAWSITGGGAVLVKSLMSQRFGGNAHLDGVDWRVQLRSIQSQNCVEDVKPVSTHVRSVCVYVCY
eukprot:1195574-Prorocentrum_minimum.AAC.2